MNFWVPWNVEQLTVHFTRRTKLYGVEVMSEEQ
jgi:hypothetical protein